MGFFSFNQEIAIDLGTANTIILYNDKIVVDAPSMVALDNRTGKLKAVGHEAQAMYGRAPENIRVIRPLRLSFLALSRYSLNLLHRSMSISSKVHLPCTKFLKWR